MGLPGETHHASNTSLCKACVLVCGRLCFSHFHTSDIFLNVKPTLSGPCRRIQDWFCLTCVLACVRMYHISISHRRIGWSRRVLKGCWGQAAKCLWYLPALAVTFLSRTYKHLSKSGDKCTCRQYMTKALVLFIHPHAGVESIDFWSGINHMRRSER